MAIIEVATVQPQEKPHGLIPKWLIRDNRIEDILSAIGRNTDKRIKIPVEWFEEYNELARELRNE